MKLSKPKAKRLYYLALLLPFILALISWWEFPQLVQWLSITVFGYRPLPQPASPVWSALIIIFYSWFTFLTIGVGGSLAISAWLSRRRIKQEEITFYPSVSFIVPAFNEQHTLPRCINSVTKCAAKYPGQVEIIVVDDGSLDISYEVAFASLQSYTGKNVRIRTRVVRHMANLGKIEALRTGANCALGQIIAIVDADSWWHPDALRSLVEYMQTNRNVAVTGYIHPSEGDADANPLVTLQQIEYSQGISVFRCAQALGNAVTVVPGAIGLFEANALRSVLTGRGLKSVTEDSEMTLELQKKGYSVGYLNTARSETEAPKNLKNFWKQRQRWFIGWLHNTLGVHRDLLMKKRWLSLLLWYSLITEYFGALIEVGAVVSFPFLFWFSPDKTLFVLNLIWFGAYALLISVVTQTIALRYAYGNHNYTRLLYYTPFYPILWLINLFARTTSLAKYALGQRGKWHTQTKPS